MGTLELARWHANLGRKAMMHTVVSARSGCSLLSHNCQLYLGVTSSSHARPRRIRNASVRFLSGRGMIGAKNTQTRERARKHVRLANMVMIGIVAYFLSGFLCLVKALIAP